MPRTPSRFRAREMPSVRLRNAGSPHCGARARRTQIVGLCLGTLVLAAAGRLDRKHATTHGE